VIKPPSLQSERSLIYSGDPALSLPEDPAERQRLLELARETGRWQDLIAEGQQPTTFDVKPLTGSEFDYWCGEVRRRNLIDQEAAALAVRLAIRKVGNLGEYQVGKREKHGDFWMAGTAIIDAIYAAAGNEGRAVILELGACIVERAQESPSPK